MIPTAIDRKARLGRPPQEATLQGPLARRRNWEEVCQGFTLAQARAEAERCLQCPAAPCQRACPLGNDIPGALALLEAGEVRAAAERFRVTSPMPEICGRVCPQERLCEGSCVVGKRGVPVHIGQIERFVADYDRTYAGLPPIVPERSTPFRIAIVGAGPAGLAAAEALRARGHQVVVFDAWPKPGGLLQYGIPPFKLPPRLVTAKIAQLATAGVRFVGNRRIQSADDFAAIRAECDAVILAIGASVPKRLGVEGEDLDGVWSAAEFLPQATAAFHDLPPERRSRPVVADPVVVIGGGDTAMDCSRTALRLGATEVRCIYRRDEAAMPCRPHERAYAREEGVQFQFQLSPTRLIGENGAVVGVECARTVVSEPDATGRRRIVVADEPPIVIPARTVIVAVGYDVSPDVARFVPDLARNPDATIRTDANGATNLPGVFAAGDAIRGPNLVVNALADGLRVAAAVDAYVVSSIQESSA